MKKIMSYSGAFFLTGLLGFSLSFMGCQKKQEEVKPAPVVTQTAPAPDTNAAKLAAKVTAENAAKSTSMLGVWKGEFDNHATTLKITEQKGNEFSGTIVVNSREQINQKINGKVNYDTKEVTMQDMIKVRTAGTYSGKLSEDGKKLSGTFTMTVDKIKVKFSLSLK